ncbi:MAG: IS110 family transposase [Planctomycetes bacterium]|nr:IS110 family transposase [Planctomycetota bacterium]
MARRKKSRNQAVPAPALPQSLEQVNLHAAGIDCGATEHYVAVSDDRDPQPVRKFGTFTADLLALVQWLLQCGITTVALESTGVYWIPLYELLVTHGIECLVVDPRRLKNVPGRKTDWLDCQWIQKLHTFGLLRGSFRPDDEICVLRSYMRQRDTLVRYAAQHIQHMQKALEQMNLKLTEVISDITGVTGLRIIDAILAGERDPETLAALRHEKCQNDEATIALALEGNWREEHLFALRQAVELYRFYHQKISELDRQIETYLQRLPDKSGGEIIERSRPRSRSRNEPAFNVPQYVLQLSGVDLTTLDGFRCGYNMLDLLSEIGTDMSAWPDEKHFASWLGLCPGIKKTGGRWLSGARPKNACRAARIFRLAAYALSRAKCALGAFFRRLKARLGSPKAITATAHKLARILYRMLKYGKPYVDQGMEYYEQKYRQRVLKNLKRRAAELGFELVAVAAAAAN